MADNYSIVEPLGNRYSSSKLERYWKSFEGKYGLKTSRIIQFDPYASMSRSPEKYILEKFEISEKLPDDEWVENNLKVFIRDEGMVTSADSTEHFLPEIEGEVFLPDEYLEKYMPVGEDE